MRCVVRRAALDAAAPTDSTAVARNPKQTSAPTKAVLSDAVADSAGTTAAKLSASVANDLELVLGAR